jgi:hypothetical protein
MQFEVACLFRKPTENFGGVQMGLADGLDGSAEYRS